MRYLNGFVLIGLLLLVVSVTGLVTQSAFLTEPGQEINRYASLEYLGAAIIMLVNGAISIHNLHRQEEFTAAGSKTENGKQQPGA